MTTNPMPTTSPTVDERDERKRKRAAILKFSLAGAAVLGIGAAATSAAWTDDAWFTAGGSAGTSNDLFELEGRIGGDPDAAWESADDITDAVTIDIDSGYFASMVPGETRSVPIEIRNNSETATIEVAEGQQWAADGIFADAGSTDFAGPVSLGPGETKAITLMVTAPDSWLSDSSLGTDEVDGEIGTLRYTGTVTSVAPSEA